jgi:flagellar biosynthesis/type III secretory pathway chaperone
MNGTEKKHKRCSEKEQTVQRKNTNGGASIHKRCSEMFSKLKQCHKKNGHTNIFLQKT